jgi:hypothetical protein
MLIGTADPEALAANVATLKSFAVEAVRLEGVETLQVFCEIWRAGAEAFLPPALHPTVPPALTWTAHRVSESPWGPFSMVHCRIECRSGLRQRGFLRGGFIDSPAAAVGLSEGWGYALRPGEIDLQAGYHETKLRVETSGAEVLDLSLEDPVVLRPQDTHFVASMNLAQTPNGLRLVQVEAEFEVERAERGRPQVRAFDPEAWHCPGLEPSHPVAALLARGAVTLPALRFVCRPDVLAFAGSEKVGGAS